MLEEVWDKLVCSTAVTIMLIVVLWVFRFVVLCFKRLLLDSWLFGCLGVFLSRLSSVTTLIQCALKVFRVKVESLVMCKE